MYSNTKPLEQRKQLSPYSIPGCKKITKFTGNPHDALRDRPAFISFDVKNQHIRISKAAVIQMRLSVGMRFHFIAMDELLYCAVATGEGNKLMRASRGDMFTKNAGFLAYVKKYFGAYGTFKCSFKKTTSEFNGNPLYELELPYRYKRTFFTNQYKIQ